MFLKLFIPPIFQKVLGSFSTKSEYGWYGNYASWDEASRKCTGYNSNDILKKVKRSTLLVKEDKAIYERDAVLFDKIEYSFPLLSGLMWIAAQNKGKLNVIDFGGSLGSTFFQNREFLKNLPEIYWNIIEQHEFVKSGKEFFEDNKLRFFFNINECLLQYKKNRPNVILLSSVLQYLEKPYELIEMINDLKFDYVIVDRTLFTIQGKDRLTIQTVPPSIYKASYPAWFFDQNHFITSFLKSYRLLFEFESCVKGEEKILIDNKELGTIKGFFLSKL